MAKSKTTTKTMTKTTTKKTTRANRAATGAKGKAKAATEARAPATATRANPRNRGGDRASGKTKKRTGILDAAAQILAKAKEPMGCNDIVEQAIAKGLWSTSGKTPGATLYSAILREIQTKGKQARFEKVERGRFRLRKSAA